MARVLVSGGSGLIGAELCRSLRQSGHTIVRLVRPGSSRTANKRQPGEPDLPWYPKLKNLGLSPSRLGQLDAVVHLAGENISQGRWTEDKKRRIEESRVGPTEALSRLLAGMDQPPRVLLAASAIGIYGDRGDESMTEEDEPGAGFLPRLCKAWEDATAPAREAGIRVVHLRFGVVLSTGGGALKKLLPVFRLGLGGRLGNGQAWMSWVTLRDAVRAIEFAMADDDLRGAVNVVSPSPVRNADFTRALGRAVHRPAFFPLPALALKLAYGEMAQATVLASTRVLPNRLLAEDFRFQDPDLGDALKQMLANPSPAN